MTDFDAARGLLATQLMFWKSSTLGPIHWRRLCSAAASLRLTNWRVVLFAIFLLVETTPLHAGTRPSPPVAPKLVTPPVETVAVAGFAASFTASASGSPTPSYQWRKDGVSIAGATAATYQIPLVTAASAGNYTVTVTNSAGSATSSAVELIVVQRVAGVEAVEGAIAGFSVSVSSGKTMSYQWSRNGVAIAGATAATYSIPAASALDAGTYGVTVRSPSGASAIATTELTVGAYVWSTFAGDGALQNVDGKPGSLLNPSGLSLAPDGSLYVGDGNKTVRKITASGVVSTFAGAAGQAGTTDGVGALARFMMTQDAAVDAAGNVYVTDANAQTIRKITASGAVSTLAGLAMMSGSLDGIGSSARFRMPWSVAVDASGNLYVADSLNHAVRKVTPVGAVTTFAGSLGTAAMKNGTATEARFDTPFGITLDRSGNLFVADGENHAIRKIAPNGMVTTLAGSPGNPGAADGVGADARFNYPFAVSADATGNLFVADYANQTVRKITPDGVVSTIGGAAETGGFEEGKGSIARFSEPSDVAVDGTGQLFVADLSNNRIRKGVFYSIPQITTQPANLVKAVGAAAQLKVVAKGTSPLSYQWRLAGVNIPGATTDTYNTVAVSTGSYDVVISNPAGSITSAVATLRALNTVAITQQPTSAIVASGASLALSVTATGSELTYQWRKGGQPISGATNSTYEIVNGQVAQSGAYDVVVSNEVSSVTSGVANLSVLQSVAITKSPSSIVLNPGASAVLTATVTGAAPISYQWRKGGAPITGATAASYAITGASVASAGVYDLVATNSVSTATSSAASVGINTPVTIAIQPAGKTVNPGTSISLSVVATGTAPITYQWRRNGVAVAVGTSSTFTTVVQSAQAGNYDVVVTNPVGSVTSSVAAVALNVAPTITTQPVGGAVNPGASKTLTVGVSGTAPFTYQWRKAGVPITGGTASSLTIAPIEAVSAGSYSVVVTNQVGSVTSANAVLVLNNPVEITTQPVGGELVPGASKTLSVAATGTAPLTYQWRRNGVAIPGATAAAYTIASAQVANAGVYDILVSNVVGSVTSEAAVLEMASPVVISKQPVSGTVLLGGSFKFSVTASGSGPLSYIWRKDGVRLTGGSYLVVPGWRTWRGAKADAERRGGHLATVTSSAEWDEVVRQLGGQGTSGLWIGGYQSTGGWRWVTGEPLSYTNWSSGEPSWDTPDADGLRCIVLKYSPRWNDGASSHSNSGYLLETERGEATFEVSNASLVSTGSYEVVVFNPVGGVLSQTVKLTVIDPLKIVENPYSTVTNPGSAVAFAVVATGTGPLTYQWRKNGVNISGATASTLRLASAQLGDAGSYDVVVTGASGSRTSTAASLAINNLVITQQPSGGAVVAGGSFTFSVKATGTDPITYKWRKNGVPLGNSVYTFVSGKMSWSEAKADAELKGGHLVTISSAAEWTEIARQLGTNATKFAWLGGYQPSGSMEPKGGWAWVTGEPFTYTNWQTGQPDEISRDGAPQNFLQMSFPGHRASAWNDLSNAPALLAEKPDGYILETEASGSTLTLTNVRPTDVAAYDVVLFNPTGTITSGSVNLVVQTGVVITQQPVGGVVNPGTSKVFSVTATGTEPLTYQWSRNGTPLAGGTARTLSLPAVAASDAGVYSVLVNNVVGGVRSQSVTLDVNTPATIVTPPRSVSVNPGQPFSLTVAVAGTPPFAYQWRKSGVPLAGATSGTYAVAAAQTLNAGSYDVVVSNPVKSVTSAQAVVALNSPVLFTTHPVDQAVNPGASATLGVAVSGTAPFTYQWRRNGVPLASGTSATLALPGVQTADAGVYDVVVTNIVGSQVSRGAKLSLNVAPSIVTQPANVLVNRGAPFSFRVDATGTAPLSYQWRKGGVPLAGGTAAVYSVLAAGTLSAGSYDVVVSNMVASVASNAATVAFNTPVTITAQPLSVTLNPGEPLNLSVTATGQGPITYQWRWNGKAIVGATAATFGLSAVNASNAGNYDVVVTNVVGSVTSATASVKVNAPVLITIQPASAPVNPGAAKTLSVAATGTAPLTYQWRKNGAPITGGTAASLAVSTTLGEQEGSYDVVVTNVVGSVTSNTAVISLNVPITITTDPQGLMGNVGTVVKLAVTASGTAPIGYQWRKNGANLAGATASTYTPAGGLSVSTAGVYDVVLTNVVGSVTSGTATLALNTPVKIETQPVGQTVAYGAPVTLTVVATGTAPLTYQWRRNSINIAGATEPTYGVPSAQVANAGVYSVVVTNPVGSVTSTTATLAVNAAENTTVYKYVSGSFTWPEAKANAEARGGHLVTITSADEWTRIVAQLGASARNLAWIGAWQPGGSPEPGGGWRWVTGELFVYQSWASREPNNQGNENAIQINQAGLGTWNDENGGNRYGYILEIEPIVLSSQPASLTVTEGSAATFSVAAGGSPPLTYQWRKNGVAITGGTSATLAIPSARPTDAAGYDVEIKNAAGTVTSAVAALSVRSPVVIKKHPASLVLNPEADAVFMVEATGEPPIAYQWRKGGIPIAGATSGTLSLTPTQSSDAGSYDVVLTNPIGSVTSNAASLSFNEPVNIVTPPRGAVLNPGASVTLSVTATGTGPFSYQWRKDGRVIDKATASSFVVSSVQATSAGLYDVVVTNIVGSVSSTPAQIEVNTPVSIITSPVPLAANPGTPASFSVTAAGTPPFSYQWRLNRVPIRGATAATFVVPEASAASVGNYDVIVSNIAGTAVSSAAALTLNVPLTITSQPTGGAVNPGAAFTLRVTATGTAPIAYQWYRNGAPVEGGTASSYTIASCGDSDAGDYVVVLSNVVGVLSSQSVKLIRNVPVSILVQPEGLMLNPPTAAAVSTGGSTPVAATLGTQGVLRVVATGTETLTYKWRKNGIPLVGATSASLTVEPKEPTGPGVYDVVISNVVGSVTSEPATVAFNTPLSIVSQPASLVLNPGTLATFAVVVNGTGPFGYQWKKDGVLLEGGTSDTFSIASTQPADIGRYEVVVTNVVGSVASQPASLALNTPVTFRTQPASIRVNVGAPVSFSAAVGGTAPLTYQWRKNGADIPEATAAVYTLPAVSSLDAGSYELVANNIVGSVSSATAVLVVNEPVTINTQPAGLAVNPGANASLSVAAVGTEPLTYQWFRNGVPVVGGTSAALSITAAQLTDAGEYSVKITNPAGTVSSEFARVSLNEPVSFSTQPVGSTVLTGTPALLSAVVTGTAPFSFQWSKSGVPIAGANSSMFALASAQESDGGSYSLEVTNVVGSVTSAAAILTVNSPLSITTQPAGVVVNAGSSASLSVVATGTVPVAYQWRKGGVPILGAVQSTFPLNSVSDTNAGIYDVVLTNAVGSLTSEAATVSVNRPVAILTPPGSAVLVAGNTLSLSVTVSGTEPISYEWRKDGAPVAGGTSAKLEVPGVQTADAGSYVVVVSNMVGSVTSVAAEIIVRIPVRITAGPASAIVTAGSLATFSVTAEGTAPLAYQWFKDGTPVASAVDASYTIPLAQARDEGSYSVTVSNSTGPVSSALATLTVLQPVTIVSQPRDVTALSGGSATFSVAATGTGPLGYQWRKNGSPIVGGSGDSLELWPVTALDSGVYDVVVTNSVGGVTSSSGSLTVLEAPKITTHPSDATVESGQPITLSVVAEGSGAIAYQWRKDGAILPSGIASTLVVNAAAATDAGVYAVTVSNATGSVVSHPAVVTVNAPAVPMKVSISEQPKRTPGTLGQSASLSVTATGTAPISYQWYKDGNLILGATAASYHIPAASSADQGIYWVNAWNSVKDDFGKNVVVTSNKVLFAILGAPSVTVDPVSVGDKFVDQSVQFSATVRCDNDFNYQWHFNGQPIGEIMLQAGFLPGANGYPEGVISKVINPVALKHRGTYSLRVWNACGSDESASASLELLMRRARLVKHGWSSDKLINVKPIASNSTSGTYVNSLEIDPTWPTAISQDDTLIISFGDITKFEWRWLDYYDGSKQIYPKITGKASGVVSLTMKDVSSNFKFRATNKTYKYCPSLELTDRTNTSAKYVIWFPIPAFANVENSTPPDPVFAVNLPPWSYAKENAPFDFMVSLRDTAWFGQYTYTWMKDGTFQMKNNTGFYSIPAESMSLDSGGTYAPYYPAEGKYWVEVFDELSGKTIESVHSQLYIFGD